jgi:hypothetical protein
MHGFLESTTYRDLVRELGRSPPVDSNELFDIATSFTSDEEVVGAIFDGKKGKRVDDARQQVQGALAEAQAGQEEQEALPRGARAGTRRRQGRGPRC